MLNALAELDWQPLLLSLQLALVTTLCLFVVGLPLAWWLAFGRRRYTLWIDAIVALPLVLPPTVLGFYLLVLLGPAGLLGKFWLQLSEHSLSFSFTGLVIASCCYSLPFVVQPLRDAFAAMGREPMAVAASLGAGVLDRFITVALPMAYRGVLTAAVLGFAHTLGEFGVVLMVGGNIPGETRVVSIAIYDHVETLDYSQAHLLSMVLLILSFLMLIPVYALNGGKQSEVDVHRVR